MSAEETQETKPKVEVGNDDVISIKVKDQDGGEVVFRVKRTTKFERIIQTFCQKKAWNAGQVKFLFDGNRILADDTPESLDMDDGDSIDALIEQLGGCAAL